MKRILTALVILVLSVVALSMVPRTANAAATAQGVALATIADCADASLTLTLTTVGATREYGLMTTETEVLDQFEQSTSLDDFSGTFPTYNINGAAQPEGTLIGGYAYIGETPPSAADTAEFFIAYNCSDTPGGNVVVFSCFGAYGSCPQTVNEYLSLPIGELSPSVGIPHLGLVQINTASPVQPFGVAGGEAQPFSLPQDVDGNGFDTYVVTAVTTLDTQTWVALFVGGRDYVWVPYSSVVPLTPIRGIE